MAIDHESRYRQLGHLAANPPKDLAGLDPISAESHRWLGCVAAMVNEEASNADPILAMDQISLTLAIDGLGTVLRQNNAHKIVAILHRALARAELRAPAAVQGAFIPVGAEFSALQVVGKVLIGATKDVLIIDPYMDASVLIDFAPLIAENISIRLLTDSYSTKPTLLQPPASRWIAQYGIARPLQVRLTAPRLLHDRLIVTDGSRVWSLTQSLKDFAARSPASVVRVDGEVAAQKTHAYEQLWIAAKPL